MNPIISENLENDCVYAYAANEFWVYDKRACRWYTSGFCREQYERAKQKLPHLTPEDFLTDSNDYSLLDDFELPSAALDALQEAVKGGKREAAPFEDTNPTDADADASPCAPGASDAPLSPSPSAAADAGQGGGDNAANPAQASSASPADAGAAAQSPSDAEAVSLAAGSDAAAFDYSGLSPETVSVLRMAEKEISTARKTYICRVSAAVAAAHDELCGACDNLSQAHNNQHSERTFGAWCSSVGIGRKTAERLLQVNALLSGATPDEQAALEAASPSLLYAAAKPSAPTELVQAVKDGDITTHKQYQEALAEIRARDAKIQELMEVSEDAARRADEARAWAKKVEQDAAAAQQREEVARAAAHRYHTQVQEIEAQRNTLLDQQTEYIDRIHELEARPVEVAVQQPTEEQIAAAAKRRTAMVEAQLHSVQERLDDALDRVSGFENGAYMAAAAFADSAARTVDSIRAAFWALAAELPDEDFSDALAPLDEAVRKICDREWEDEE